MRVYKKLKKRRAWQDFAICLYFVFFFYVLSAPLLIFLLCNLLSSAVCLENIKTV